MPDLENDASDHDHDHYYDYYYCDYDYHHYHHHHYYYQKNNDQADRKPITYGTIVVWTNGTFRDKLFADSIEFLHEFLYANTFENYQWS